MNEIEAVGAEAVLTATAHRESSAPDRPERPWIFGFLIAPSAVVANGVVQGGTLAYLLSRQGIGSGDQSKLIDFLALPTIFYFLWSPITDFLVRRRTWLLIGGVLAGILMALGFHQPSLTSSGAEVLMLISACLSQLVVSACGGMMGALHSERSKRVAGSFYQAGSLGFGALSVSVLLWLSSRVSRDALGLAAATIIAVPALFALAAPPQDDISTGSFARTMGNILREFKATFLRWEAIPYTLCMLFPMASGAAISLLTGVAKSYGLNGDSVAWMNGLFGGLLMAAGSIAATAVPVRVSAPVAYLSAGVINAATLAVLWLGPMTPTTYLLGVTLYLLTVGFAYGFFTAVVLEFLGASGKSGSGRYSIINSLGNIPVLYMIRLDGWGGDHFGPRGLSATECVVGGLGGTLLLSYFLLRRKPAPAAAASTA
jgi:MFS transporter, PAT family, beta-lactamase induction signal transducer AmpG